MLTKGKRKQNSLNSPSLPGKITEYKQNAAASFIKFKPGATCHIQAGSIDGTAFIFADGALALEMTGPEPIDHARHTIRCVRM
jgi:hypothetical protein